MFQLTPAYDLQPESPLTQWSCHLLLLHHQSRNCEWDCRAVKWVSKGGTQPILYISSHPGSKLYLGICSRTNGSLLMLLQTSHYTLYQPVPNSHNCGTEMCLYWCGKTGEHLTVLLVFSSPHCCIKEDAIIYYAFSSTDSQTAIVQQVIICYLWYALKRSFLAVFTKCTFMMWWPLSTSLDTRTWLPSLPKASYTSGVATLTSIWHVGYFVNTYLGWGSSNRRRTYPMQVDRTVAVHAVWTWTWDDVSHRKGFWDLLDCVLPSISPNMLADPHNVGKTPSFPQGTLCIHVS